VASKGGKSVLGIAWPGMRIESDGSDDSFVVGIMLPHCPPSRRVYRRGKLYLFQGSKDALLSRVRREMGVP
jgi:hypothetical protein